MNRPRYEVPPELTNLLLEFTVNVMIEHPTDLVDYAARYFANLRDERERSAGSGGPPVQPSVTTAPALAENDDLIYSDDEEPIPMATASIEDSMAPTTARIHPLLPHLPPLHSFLKPLRPSLPSLPSRTSAGTPMPGTPSSTSTVTSVPFLPPPPPPLQKRQSDVTAAPSARSKGPPAKLKGSSSKTKP